MKNNFRSVREGAEPHIHPGCTEIGLCLKGNLRFEAEGQEYPFTPGRIFVSNKNEPHRLTGGPKGLNLYGLLFKVPRSSERILGLGTEESSWIVYELAHFPVRLFPASGRVKTAFDRVFELHEKRDANGIRRRLQLRTAVLELLLSLIEAPTLPSTKKTHPDKRISGIVRQIRENPRKNWPVDALAEEAGLSLVAFTQIFKLATGLPPHAFLLSCRLEQARNDLSAGSVSVGEVAQRYGFSSSHHFASAFRDMFGVCPSSYKK